MNEPEIRRTHRALTFCRNLGWFTVVSLALMVLPYFLVYVWWWLPPLICTLFGPLGAAFLAFSKPITSLPGQQLPQGHYSLAVLGVLYYVFVLGFILWLICMIITHPRGLN